MRQQGTRRDSKVFEIVDEDYGIPVSIAESYRGFGEVGPLAQSDPRSILLSMSEFGKGQHYDVYDYSTSTRAEHGQGYPSYATHPSYTNDYVAPQPQVSSGLPHSAPAYHALPPAQAYAAPDPAYYGAQQVQYPAYVETTSRPLPEIISFSPNQGHQGTKVTVKLQSLYDLDQPNVTPIIMFGQKRCSGLFTKTAQQGQPFQYSLSVDAPLPTPTGSPSPQVALSLTFDESPVTWSPPMLEFGSFTYLNELPLYPVVSPVTQKKRKLSPEASPRRSPTKKQSLHNLGGARAVQQFRRPSLPDQYSQSRRFSVPEVPQGYGGLPRVQTQNYYQPQQTTPTLHSGQSPSWSYLQDPRSATRSPSTAGISAGGRNALLPSPSTNPPLIRTSTIQQSPQTTMGAAQSVTQSFNPYAMYPSNTKAVLKIEGDLNSMSNDWTATERETGRRLVQFRRSQTGSVISATFEPVTLEDRIPNSICVSCIWWEEKSECYVTSVDTISLLESLVAVRFTVEEKNRIRRNLEGFRPATVSKTRQDSEEFFKLIMGFPNPKPRNIEKDVKVFPWRVLAVALKKIIGKYSASYSSTAGALHTPGAGAGPTYPDPRASNVGLDHGQSRPAASPHSTSSSATSHTNAYAANLATSAYAANAMGGASAGLGIGPSADPPPDLRLTVPPTAPPHHNQTTSWQHPPHALAQPYSADLSATRGSWDFPTPTSYLSASPATGLPSSAPSYHYPTRMSSMTTTQGGGVPETGRFVPLQYEDSSHQTSNG